MTRVIASEERSSPAARPKGRAFWRALAVWLAYVALAIGTLVVETLGHHATPADAANMVGFLVFASMGAVLATKLPDNAVGWLLLLVALAAIANRAVGAYVAAAASGQDLPAAALVAWVESWLWGVSVASALVILPAVFPTGRPPAGHLTTYVWLMLALFAAAPVFLAFAPGPMRNLPSVANPFGVAALEPVAAGASDILPSLGIVPIATCALIPLLRYRAAGSVERAQLRWFAFSAVLLAVVLVANVVTDDALEIPLAIATALVPAAIGVAILRYRLYDIDVLISRTLVWVPLTALLGGGYAALVALLQRVFVNVTGDRSDAAVIITTLVLASLFTPVRRVLDSVVDARFRGSHPAIVGAVGGAMAPAAIGQATSPMAVDLDDPAVTRRIETIAARVVQDALAADDRRRSGAGGAG